MKNELHKKNLRSVQDFKDSLWREDNQDQRHKGLDMQRVRRRKMTCDELGVCQKLNCKVCK